VWHTAGACAETKHVYADKSLLSPQYTIISFTHVSMVISPLPWFIIHGYFMYMWSVWPLWTLKLALHPPTHRIAQCANNFKWGDMMQSILTWNHGITSPMPLYCIISRSIHVLPLIYAQAKLGHTQTHNYFSYATTYIHMNGTRLPERDLHYSTRYTLMAARQ
jgi:hypothetical protein